MKIRTDFVTNSSSTCYTITNKSSNNLTLVDFVKENAHLLAEYNKWHNQESYYAKKYSSKNWRGYSDADINAMIDDAKIRNEIFRAGKTQDIEFSDNANEFLGFVYRAILSCGESVNFTWEIRPDM